MNGKNLLIIFYLLFFVVSVFILLHPLPHNPPQHHYQSSNVSKLLGDICKLKLQLNETRLKLNKTKLLLSKTHSLLNSLMNVINTPPPIGRDGIALPSAYDMARMARKDANTSYIQDLVKLIVIKNHTLCWITGQPIVFYYPMKDWDTYKWGTDFAEDPIWFWTHGRVGDCDDAATAVASVLKAKGWNNISICCGYPDWGNNTTFEYHVYLVANKGKSTEIIDWGYGRPYKGGVIAIYTFGIWKVSEYHPFDCAKV